MKIRKKETSIGIVGKILNTFSSSKQDTYSADYINSALKEHYSLEETFTGKYWIDGKKIYRKVIDCGTMPNNEEKGVATGLTNIVPIKLWGLMHYGDAYITLPDIHYSTPSYSIRLYYNTLTNQVILASGGNRSTYTGYVILEYTKTTD